MFRTEQSYLGSKPNGKNMRKLGKVIRTKKYIRHSGVTLFLVVNLEQVEFEHARMVEDDEGHWGRRKGEGS